MTLQIIEADYANPSHAGDILRLLNDYALDPMGGGVALDEHARRQLIPALAELPNAFSLIAYLDDEAVGLANCLPSFSTFACKPVINIHDFMIDARHRGKGFSARLLQRVEDIANARGCCKITLEVLSGNSAACAAYRSFGFDNYQLDPKAGHAEFWHKPLHTANE
jgi:GNAT superfamily N-acetyltransferase